MRVGVNRYKIQYYDSVDGLLCFSFAGGVGADLHHFFLTHLFIDL
jgi:hypothetical protein